MKNKTKKYCTRTVYNVGMYIKTKKFKKKNPVIGLIIRTLSMTSTVRR